MPQTGNVFAGLTVADNLAIAARILPRRDRAGRIAAMLARGSGEFRGISINAKPSPTKASSIAGASAGVSPRNMATSGN